MNHRGFTLIELLVVLAIIGLLATVAVPRLLRTKERAQVAAMKSDLRNLVTIEESYLAENQRYTIDPGSSYHVSQGNNAPTIRLTGEGWTATMTSGITQQQCTVFVGSTPAPPATQEGVPACAIPGSTATPFP